MNLYRIRNILALFSLCLLMPGMSAAADGGQSGAVQNRESAGQSARGEAENSAAVPAKPKKKKAVSGTQWTQALSAAHQGVSGTDISVHLCADAQRDPPPGFADLMKTIPGLKKDIRYHGVNNFTGDHIAGYGAPGAWMMEEAAQALLRVQKALSKKGLGLIIYDAYRPRRGTDAMVDWAYRTEQTALLDGGYVARRSRHNHGTTVDLGLVYLATGAAVDMGTDFDTLTTASHTKNARGKVLQNRLTLKEAMEREGFKGYFREWWHFEMRLPESRPRDVPYGRCESDEAPAFAAGSKQADRNSQARVK